MQSFTMYTVFNFWTSAQRSVMHATAMFKSCCSIFITSGSRQRTDAAFSWKDVACTEQSPLGPLPVRWPHLWIEYVPALPAIRWHHSASQSSLPGAGFPEKPKQRPTLLVSACTRHRQRMHRNGHVASSDQQRGLQHSSSGSNKWWSGFHTDAGLGELQFELWQVQSATTSGMQLGKPAAGQIPSSMWGKPKCWNWDVLPQATHPTAACSFTLPLPGNGHLYLWSQSPAPCDVRHPERPCGDCEVFDGKQRAVDAVPIP